MNFQRYGYTKWQSQQFDEYFTANRNQTPNKKHQLATEKGWVSRQDADDDLNSAGGGYHRRVYLLPSHITSFASDNRKLIELEPNREQTFHHRVIGLPSFSPFTNLENINILEFDLSFNLELINTQTTLKDVIFYLVLCPDPYPALIEKFELRDGPKVNENGEVIEEAKPGYPEDSRGFVYDNANLELRRMMEFNIERNQHPLEPFEKATQFCAERYSIFQKSIKQIRSSYEGKFHLNFKFKTSPKNGDINLRKNEGLFLIAKCYCASNISPTQLYTASNISFRYSVN